MLATVGNRFNWWATNIGTLTTGVTSLGTTVTADASVNTVGTTVELLSGATVANDVYGIQIMANNYFAAASARNMLINIRTDPAGGTSWTTVIANLATIAQGLPGSTTGGSNSCAVWWYFPLFIKAGSSIGANVQCSVGGVSGGIGATVWGRPTRPELVRVGSYVTTLGANTGTSAGTSVTPGTNGADGTYVQMGSNLTANHWWWQAGFGINDTTVAGGAYYMDLARGDGTTRDLIMENQLITTTSSEQCGVPNVQQPNSYCEVPTGVGIYGRMSASSTPDSSVTMVAYGLGG